MPYQILLTGCCGFIGSHLTEKLLMQGHHVTGIDNFDSFYDRSIKEQNLALFSSHPAFHFFEADIRNSDFASPLKNRKFDVVLHLAAKTGIQPSINSVNDYIDTNITGTANVLNYMKMAGIGKFVFTSSSSVYGNSTSLPFNESTPVSEPISPYAFTKLSAELLNFTFHHLHGFDIVNLRLFTVYGPRQRPDLAIHKFTRLMHSGQVINVYGDGTTARDYTFVSDTVNGFIGAMNYVINNRSVFETFNLGNNHPVTLKKLIELLSCASGIEPKLSHLPMQPGDVNVTYADISKAQRLLGYNPDVQMGKGLKLFVDWYISQVQKTH